GYGWLFPGADGQANVGIGVGLGTTRRQAPLRGDLARFCALLAERGDIGPGVTPGPVTGGWLRMGGTGTPPAARDVLLGREARGGAAGGPAPPGAGGGARAGDGRRRAAGGGWAPPPGGPRPRLHRGAGRRVRRLYARGRGAAERAAAPATGRIGGHPAADRTR